MSFNEVNLFKLEVIKNDKELYLSYKKSYIDLVSIVSSSLSVNTKDVKTKIFHKPEQQILKTQASRDKNNKLEKIELELFNFSEKHNLSQETTFKFIEEFKFNQNFKSQIDNFLLEKIF